MLAGPVVRFRETQSFGHSPRRNAAAAPVSREPNVMGPRDSSGVIPTATALPTDLTAALKKLTQAARSSSSTAT